MDRLRKEDLYGDEEEESLREAGRGHEGGQSPQVRDVIGERSSALKRLSNAARSAAEALPPRPFLNERRLCHRESLACGAEYLTLYKLHYLLRNASSVS